MGKHKEKSKKHHKTKKKHKTRERRKSSSSSSEEWVEKQTESPPLDSSDAVENKKEASREQWMSLPSNFLTESHLDRRKEREEAKRQEKLSQQYNPRDNVRELNPYWKDGGDGLPNRTFIKPGEGSSERPYLNKNHTSNWRKKESTVTSEASSTTTTNNDVSEQLSDKELNVLAAKLVKAEIMGNTKLATELKEKLEKARANQTTQESNEVLLTRTDSKGYTRPVKMDSTENHRGNKNPNRKRKVETHTDGQRVRYFGDDDKYNLKQMFENEKFSSAEDQNRQFMQLSGKMSKNDDLDDIFADKIRKVESDEKTERRNRDRAIHEHRRITQSLDNCRFCLQSSNMQKHLMISMSESFYLSLPPQEPLTDNHCMLVPTRHVPCGTQLDENEWNDLLNFRKALVKMFAAEDDDVIFFETAVHLNRHPHMILTCVPLPKEQGDLAPIYFKKAIDESETEWASNKKLVSLKDRDVRKAIPKGLPYFYVSFGMEEGYAHVVEDYQMFPDNFAEEIVGGMLDLHHSKWRKPKRQSFEEQSRRVSEFNRKWKDFDFTVQQSL